LDEILKVTDGYLLRSEEEVKTLPLFKGISIDSRTIISEELFVALRGKNYNGHNFVEEALIKGAKAAVVEEEIWRKMGRRRKGRGIFILVKDTLKAL